MPPRFFVALWLSGSALCIASALAGCNGAPESTSVGSDAGVAMADASSDGGGGPRRPARRYYMARTDKRCEVYSVEGDEISTPTFALCPASIEVGERIRLMGRSCLREGAPAREQPVVCPFELILAEQQGRARDRLAAAGESADGGVLDGGAPDSDAGSDRKRDAGSDRKRDAGAGR